jgi:hypothetical protein
MDNDIVCKSTCHHPNRYKEKVNSSYKMSSMNWRLGRYLPSSTLYHIIIKIGSIKYYIGRSCTDCAGVFPLNCLLWCWMGSTRPGHGIESRGSFLSQLNDHRACISRSSRKAAPRLDSSLFLNKPCFFLAAMNLALTRAYVRLAMLGES